MFSCPDLYRNCAIMGGVTSFCILRTLLTGVWVRLKWYINSNWELILLLRLLCFTVQEIWKGYKN